MKNNICEKEDFDENKRTSVELSGVNVFVNFVPENLVQLSKCLLTPFPICDQRLNFFQKLESGKINVIKCILICLHNCTTFFSEYYKFKGTFFPLIKKIRYGKLNLI